MTKRIQVNIDEELLEIIRKMKGFGKKDDTLPPRMLNEAPTDGPSEGWVVQLEPMLTEYYRSRGWDENGVPKEQKLEELGLANLI